MTKGGTEKTYPPSFLQYWMLEQQKQHGGLPVWNRPAPLEIIGSLDEQALKQTLRVTHRKHLPLHSKLDPKSMLWRASPDEADLLEDDCIDLCELTPPHQKEALLRHLKDLNDRVFDLTRDFPWRAQLLRLGPRRHILNLSFHHLAIDGGSLPILIQEITSLYDKITGNKNIPMPPFLPFDQFSKTEKEAYQQKEDDFISYHQGHFSTRPEVLHLPGYISDAPVSFQQDHMGENLSSKASQALRQFSRGHNVTLFMSLYGIFNALIFLTSGQKNIFLGTFFSDRRQKGLQNTLGLLFNIIPLSISPDPTMTFAELITLVRTECLKAFGMADYPYLKYLEHGTDGQTPIIFQFRNFPKSEKTEAHLSIREYPYHHGYGNFDITFEAEPVEQEIALTLSYRTDRYTKAAMTALLNDFITLTGRLLDRPDTPLFAHKI